MSVNRRLDDAFVDQELETVTCTGIHAAPVDGFVQYPSDARYKANAFVFSCKRVFLLV